MLFAAGRRQPTQSRRWDGHNLALLRRKWAALPESSQPTFLRVGLEELAAFAATHDSWQDPSDMRMLLPEYALPLLDLVHAFFESALRSVDIPKEGLILPREIIYYQVCNTS